MASYKFEAKGLASNGQGWTTSGIVGGGNYVAAHEQALRETYAQLTEGRAAYNNLGKFGRPGPYQITSMRIDEILE